MHKANPPMEKQELLKQRIQCLAWAKEELSRQTTPENEEIITRQVRDIEAKIKKLGMELSPLLLSSTSR